MFSVAIFLMLSSIPGKKKRCKIPLNWGFLARLPQYLQLHVGRCSSPRAESSLLVRQSRLLQVQDFSACETLPCLCSKNQPTTSSAWGSRLDGGPEQEIAYVHPRNKSHWGRAPAHIHQPWYHHRVPIPTHVSFGPPALPSSLVSTHSKPQACGFLRFGEAKI